MIKSLKELISKVPYPIGNMLTKVPFKYRLGKTYTEFQKMIADSMQWSADQTLSYIISQLNDVKRRAQSEFSFYEELYADYGVSGLEIKDLSDWIKLPLVNKEQLRNSLHCFSGNQKINTGGTSGEPFAFYIDKGAWAREWAHMHFIWESKGYDYTMPKITLRGKNLGKELYLFNPVHNEFLVNTYVRFDEQWRAKKIKELLLAKKIKFVHGYPSAIFNFFLELEKALSKNDVEEIKAIVKVCLLGSEFPLPYMMDYLKKNWNLDYISWYGHSEMSILAYDKNKENRYKPFITYGYAEVFDNELIGTSYHNMDMPLIRYRTGDLVDSVQKNGLMEEFTIKEGRSGDFVEDKIGKLIPLTALIFGRHHAAFNIFDFIQISQETAGEATIFLTDKEKRVVNNIPSLFDFSNINIDFKFKIIDNPILSKAGKFKLKV